LALYGLVGYLSLLYADNFDRAQRTLYFFFRDSLAAVVIVILLQQAATLRRVIWGLLAAGIFMGSITVYQQLTNTFTNNYGGFAQAGINFIADGANDYRIAGPFANPNAYAQILNVLIPLALDRLWNERTRPFRLFAAWALAVCTLSVFFTFSRGGFLTLILVLGLMLIRRPPRLSVLLITIAIAIPLFQFLPANYTERISTLTNFLPSSESNPTDDNSFRGRTSENAVAWLMFMDQPILGVGLDNYPEKYLEYSSLLGIDPRREARAPSSLYLEILAEEGLVGLGVFLIILGVMLYGLQRAKENFTVVGMNDYASMAIAFTVAMLGYLFAALFKNSAYSNFFWMLTGIALAMSQVAENEVKAYREAQDARLNQTALP
jgi:O-antigen ligase